MIYLFRSITTGPEITLHFTGPSQLVLKSRYTSLVHHDWSWSYATFHWSITTGPEVMLHFTGPSRLVLKLCYTSHYRKNSVDNFQNNIHDSGIHSRQYEFVELHTCTITSPRRYSPSISNMALVQNLKRVANTYLLHQRISGQYR